ncbi:hypothetical protein F5Y18DRAFT_394322 [Xylariaceae sp. FL1019]|nr:hypothetical protein F5Y18DRAFT_394322 [Xylariaceae sp. FL1019]
MVLRADACPQLHTSKSLTCLSLLFVLIQTHCSSFHSVNSLPMPLEPGRVPSTAYSSSQSLSKFKLVMSTLPLLAALSTRNAGVYHFQSQV